MKFWTVIFGIVFLSLFVSFWFIDFPIDTKTGGQITVFDFIIVMWIMLIAIKIEFMKDEFEKKIYYDRM